MVIMFFPMLYNIFEGMPYFQIPKGSKCSVSPRDLSCHKMYGMHWYAKYVYRMHPTPARHGQSQVAQMLLARDHPAGQPSRSFAWLLMGLHDGSFALFGEIAKSHVP